MRAASDRSAFILSSGLNGLPFSMPMACIWNRSSGPKLSNGSSSTSMAKSSKKWRLSGNSVSMSCPEPLMNSIDGGEDALSRG